MSIFILTSSEQFEGEASLEVRTLVGDCKLDWVATGLCLVQSDQPYADVARALAPSVFIRHTAPGYLMGEGDPATESARNIAEGAAESIRPNMAFSVQVRFAQSHQPHAASEAAEAIGGRIARITEGRIDTKHPTQIVSVFSANDQWFAGVSSPAQNRSAWAGGERRFRRDDGMISRAEHKLLEALEVFDLDLPTVGEALDIGAAPGGWSRVLAERGMNVTAVDPAKLDPRITRVGAVHHVPTKIEAYEPEGAPFCFIANDMRADAPDSVAATLRALEWRTGDACAISTIKLPEKGQTSQAMLAAVATALARFRAAGFTARARNLYHNRSEVTACVTP